MDGGEKKTVWIIANWKSNKTISEALDWISQVGPQVRNRPDVKVVVCPPAIALEEVKKAVLVGNFSLLVGAQDLSPFEDGPYTGEESARILSEVVDLTILGHSERRQNFGETDQMVAEKVQRARMHNIIPLVCVQNEETLVPEGTALIAYEPVFAIGSGNPDTPQNAQSVATKLKEKTDDLPVLYGGSVTEENVKAFLQQDNIDGVLVGGASLNPEQFVKIINVAYVF